MKTAYISQNHIVAIDKIVDAEWTGKPGAELTLTLAAPGFAGPLSLSVAEPHASEVWSRICPADPEEEPAARPAPAPAPPPSRNGRPHPISSNGHTQPTVNGGLPANIGPDGTPNAWQPYRRPHGQVGAKKFGNRFETGNGSSAEQAYGPPTSGKQLFAWAKRVSERESVDLLGYLKEWGKGQGLPGRFDELDRHQVDAAFAEAGKWLEWISTETAS